MLISFEGIEGTGKSTQALLLAEYLKGKGLDVVLTAEPGGTRIGQSIREVLLSVEHTGMHSTTELLLYFASRSQLIREVIEPSLKRGGIVISDRFTDSTIAYQGYGRGIALDLIDSIDWIATQRLRPDITILLDLDVEVGLKRNRGINKTDRLELEDIAFHQQVRKGYHKLAESEPRRIRLIDSSGSIRETQLGIMRIISEHIGL